MNRTLVSPGRRREREGELCEGKEGRKSERGRVKEGEQEREVGVRKRRKREEEFSEGKNKGVKGKGGEYKKEESESGREE